MNEQTAKILPHPVLIEMDVATPESPRRSWLRRRLFDLGINMATPPVKPYWNTTMVTAWVAVIVGFSTILAAIGGLYIYTRDTNFNSGVEKGRQIEKDAQRDAQIDELQKALKIKKLTDPNYKEPK